MLNSKLQTEVSVIMPSGSAIDIVAPKSFHIPRVLADGGLKNYEVHSLAAALALVELREGAFYDIGANIGVFSLCVATALHRRCHAYEPFPEAAAVLDGLRSRYRLPITVHGKGVGGEAGKAQFYLSDRSDMSNSLDPNFRKHRGVLEVDVTTLDIEIERDRPCLLKIDTETTEDQVIAGGLSQIARHRPPIIVELLNDRIANRVRALLQPLGYRAYSIRGGLRLAESDTIQTSLDGDSRNWLFSCAALDREFDDALNKWRGVIHSI